MAEPCSPASVVTAGIPLAGFGSASAAAPHAKAGGTPRPPPPAAATGASSSSGFAAAYAVPSRMRSPTIERASLQRLEGQMQHSVTRPGYNESALYVARAIVSHARAAAADAAADAAEGEGEVGVPSPPPTLEEAHRFIRSVCGRALFKPCSLIATVVYLERLHRLKELHPLILSEGWQLVALTLLVVAAKVWDSDYPISNADICSPVALPHGHIHAPPSSSAPSAAASGFGGRAHGGGGGGGYGGGCGSSYSGSYSGGSGGGGGVGGAPSPAPSPVARAVSTRCLNTCERRVLAMLSYSTMVTQSEFARAYLTLPFAFRDSPLLPSHHSGGVSVTPQLLPSHHSGGVGGTPLLLPSHHLGVGGVGGGVLSSMSADQLEPIRLGNGNGVLPPPPLLLPPSLAAR